MKTYTEEEIRGVLTFYMSSKAADIIIDDLINNRQPPEPSEEERTKIYELFDDWVACVKDCHSEWQRELVIREVSGMVYRDVWEIQIPPDMPEDVLIDQARKLVDVYQLARGLTERKA